jgi:hypothetical protein
MRVEVQGRGASSDHAERRLVGGLHHPGHRPPPRRRHLDRLSTDGASVHLGDGRRLRRARPRRRADCVRATTLLGAAATIGSVHVADRPRQEKVAALPTDEQEVALRDIAFEEVLRELRKRVATWRDVGAEIAANTLVDVIPYGGLIHSLATGIAELQAENTAWTAVLLKLNERDSSSDARPER